jgi:hypothetical protein
MVENPITYPTERSIPFAMITKVSAYASSSDVAAEYSRVWMF